MTKTLKVMNTHIAISGDEKTSLSLLSQSAPQFGTKLAKKNNEKED